MIEPAAHGFSIGHLRTLGPLERFFFRYPERNPSHFVLVAEFDMDLDPGCVADALLALQSRHQLLSVHVVGDSTTVGYCRSVPVAPIPLAHYPNIATDWGLVVLDELTRPFDRAVAPLMRATLLTRANESTLLLVFDHVIADGISSVLVLDDLLAVLNGEMLQPLPLPIALEDLIRHSFGSLQPGEPSLESDDPRMSVPTSTRAAKAATQYMHRCTMSREETARLVDRCRWEGTTVHAAIVTAASRARCTESGEQFVRTFSPVDIRTQLAQYSGSCICITSARTAMAPGDGTDFWTQARSISNRLPGMKTPAALMVGAALLERHLPIHIDCDGAEHFFCSALPFELLVSNLGVQDIAHRHPCRPQAVWGPIFRTHVDHECVIGVITYGGRLRMVACAPTPTSELLRNILETLVCVSTDVSEIA